MHFPHFLKFLTLALVLGLLVLAGYMGWKVIHTAEKISVGGSGHPETARESAPDERRDSLIGAESGRINFILLGRAGETYPGQNLTDTVMIASIDLESRKSAFLSLPRDLFAPIPDSNFAIKLNSLYQYGLSRDEGVEPLRRAVEDITGLDIPYYVIVDFDGFERIIDEVGGITIYSERDILDTRYPGKNYSYETFELSAGWHTLDGATALKYARERHSDPEGDFGRAKRQQQIMKAFQEKVFSIRTLVNAPSVNRMLDTLGESVRTNLTVSEMLELADLARTIDVRNAATVVVDAWRRESLLRVSHIDVGGVWAFVLVPRVGNWSEIRDLAEHVFSLESIERRQDEIEREAARILIVSRPGDAGVALRFGRAIEDAVPADTITTVTDTSLPTRSDTLLYEAGSSRKLYSVDELLRLFPLSLTTTLPNIEPSEETDIVLIVGSDLKETLIEEGAAPVSDRDDIPESDPFSEYFPAQSR